MRAIRPLQLLAVLLLAGAIALLSWALLQSQRAVEVQGPAAVVVLPSGEVWAGVGEQLWRLSPDGALLREDAVAALGLSGPPSNLHLHPEGLVLASVRDDASLALLDPRSARVQRRIHPQWPADLARHGARAINVALHPDGRIAIATGGGHAVALFDAQGRFLARTAPDLYRFTNGLWWAGDSLWTTDTNRTQLKRLDGQTLVLQQTVALQATGSARFLGPARVQARQGPAAVAIVRFHNGMTQGRIAVLDATTLAERELPQAQHFEPIDVDWLGASVLASDGATHQLLRVDATTGAVAPFGMAETQARLAQPLREREQHLRHWKWGVGGAAVLLLAGLLLAWMDQHQRAQQRQMPELAHLGTPRLPSAQRSWLTARVYGPWVFFLAPLLGLQLFDLRTLLGLSRVAWAGVLAVLIVLLLGVVRAQYRRQARLALDPTFEPAFNAPAVARLERSAALAQALQPGEHVLETALWLCPTLRWVVLTDRRLLCLTATLTDHRLEWVHARGELSDVAYLPHAPNAWSRLVGPGAAGPGWLQVRLPSGRLVEGRIGAPTVAQRMAQALSETQPRTAGAAAAQALPKNLAVPPELARRGPPAPLAAALSFVLPGLAQWLQRRSAMALLFFVSWALFVTFSAAPTLWAAWVPRSEVSTSAVVRVLGLWILSASVAAWDAWRMAPRRRHQRP